jgi:hypothetical protein
MNPKTEATTVGEKKNQFAWQDGGDLAEARGAFFVDGFPGLADDAALA